MGHQELVLGMLTGEGYEAVNSGLEIVQAFNCWDGVGFTIIDSGIYASKAVYVN